MKVSVIIPIYNTGVYLRKCIHSICEQSYRNLQIIMIDDGSDEETASICDDIASLDRRIELHHTPNGGVSRARNIGLEQAVGDVVCFVDSDDTVEPKMIEDLLLAMLRDNSDIAMCDALTITPGKSNEFDSIPDYDTSCVIEVDKISPATLTRLAGSACRCAYKRTDTLIAKHARFPEGLKFSEDRIFNIIAMSGAKRISYVKYPYYNRLIRKGSACFRYYPDMINQITKMRGVLLSVVKDNWGERYINDYEFQIAGQIRYAVTNYASKISLTAINKIRKLCDNQDIQDCLEATCSSDLRSRLIIKRRVGLLFILGVFTNIYHKICKTGLYRS